MAKQSLDIRPAGIAIDKRSPTPLYQQLFAQFREMIISGRLRAGDRLPASRTLAEEVGVSRVIVSQAYEALMLEGYLRGKAGSGTFVAELLPDKLLNAVQVKVAKAGFFKLSRTFAGNESTLNFVHFQLTPQTVTGTFNNASGGSVEVKHGGSIQFPAGAVVKKADNSAYAGTVKVNAALISPLST
ncbi:MAG: GntR family transcriptional regulator, partial [Pedobacter sp.]